MKRNFPAKLLLFGEYTVLSGSQALAVPIHCWSGSWIESDPTSNDIPPYYSWLKEQKLISGEVHEKMVSDFNNGWQYKSDIPIGFGVGSSGAYVAALFERYFGLNSDFQEQSTMLAQMESYFHEASSGMDPLVSFHDKAVFKDDLKKFHLLEDPGWPEDVKVYLLNSGIQRETSGMVACYKRLTQESLFASMINKQLIPMVDHAIHFYLNGQRNMLEECIEMISQYQFHYFTDFITDDVKKVWSDLNHKPGVHMKLCGAGGGGFYLIIDMAKNDLSEYSLIPVN